MSWAVHGLYDEQPLNEAADYSAMMTQHRQNPGVSQYQLQGTHGSTYAIQGMTMADHGTIDVNYDMSSPWVPTQHPHGYGRRGSQADYIQPAQHAYTYDMSSSTGHVQSDAVFPPYDMALSVDDQMDRYQAAPAPQGAWQYPVIYERASKRVSSRSTDTNRNDYQSASAPTVYRTEGHPSWSYQPQAVDQRERRDSVQQMQWKSIAPQPKGHKAREQRRSESSPQEYVDTSKDDEQRSSSKDRGARTHPWYYLAPHADGLYHCPERHCPHQPTKLKCNYDKYIDSHQRPFTCRVDDCANDRFSSTACLLRHEREAHGLHGHGVKPYTCIYEGCDRADAASGFPRRYNLMDHMRRVHGHQEDDGVLATDAKEAEAKVSKSRRKRTQTYATEGAGRTSSSRASESTRVKVEPRRLVADDRGHHESRSSRRSRY